MNWRSQKKLTWNYCKIKYFCYSAWSRNPNHWIQIHGNFPAFVRSYPCRIHFTPEPSWGNHFCRRLWKNKNKRFRHEQPIEQLFFSGQNMPKINKKKKKKGANELHSLIASNQNNIFEYFWEPLRPKMKKYEDIFQL